MQFFQKRIHIIIFFPSRYDLCCSVLHPLQLLQMAMGNIIQKALLESNLVFTNKWPMHFNAVADKHFLIFMMFQKCSENVLQTFGRIWSTMVIRESQIIPEVFGILTMLLHTFNSSRVTLLTLLPCILRPCLYHTTVVPLLKEGHSLERTSSLWDTNQQVPWTHLIFTHTRGYRATSNKYISLTSTRKSIFEDLSYRFSTYIYTVPSNVSVVKCFHLLTFSRRWSRSQMLPAHFWQSGSEGFPIWCDKGDVDHTEGKVSNVEWTPDTPSTAPQHRNSFAPQKYLEKKQSAKFP